MVDLMNGKDLDIDVPSYDEMMQKEILEIKTNRGTILSRSQIVKYLHITENVNELQFYEAINLIWKVKFDEIPGNL